MYSKTIDYGYKRHISAILTLIAGIGIFLIACQMMSSNLESASSTRLKSLFSKASRSRLLGVSIGTVGTAAIQSSGATTVMVIGFVNAGIMSLTQAATIIYGANIGTTVTAQIVALGMFGGASAISTTIIFSAFAGSGGATFGSIFQTMFPDAPQEQLAMFHTIFNVITVILILPLTDALVKLVCRIIPDDVQTEEKNRSRFYYIDWNMLKTPPIAVLQTKNEIVALQNTHST